jgi:peptidoglycan-associated lipoprotein
MRGGGDRFALGGTVLALVAVVVLMAGCPPKYPKCDGDKDCRAGEYCVNNQCQQCRADNDCPGGGNCKAGRCEAPAAKTIGCSDDSQCPPNQSCIGGACKPCSDDAQCGAGGKCNAGRCARASSTGEENLPPRKCTLEPVYFDFNEYSLTTEGTGAIDRDADCIKKDARGATLVGHSDPRGTEEYNLALSDRRAQSVKDRLVKLGVTTNLKTVAKGELDASGQDEAGWAHDRRVDVQ